MGEDRGIETAQYIDDRGAGTDNKYKKGTIQDYKNKELAKTVPRFVMGIGGGLEAREGFGSASLADIRFGNSLWVNATEFPPTITG